MKLTSMQLRMTQPMKMLLKDEAKKNDTTMTGVIMKALNTYFNNQTTEEVSNQIMRLRERVTILEGQIVNINTYLKEA